jgi:hypothetical protein
MYSAISAYELLLLVPVEYLSKACRLNLVTKAVRADVVLGTMLKEKERQVIVLRTFLERVFTYLGRVDHSVSSLFFLKEVRCKCLFQMIPEFLEHLMSPLLAETSSSAAYISVTLTLIEGHVL